MPASKPISTVKKRLIKSVTSVTNSSAPKKKKIIDIIQFIKIIHHFIS